MRNVLKLSAPIVAAVLALWLSGLAGPAAAQNAPAYAGTKLWATLDSKGSTPAGDPKATGQATVWVDTGANKVCYTLGVAGLDSPTMAHIHKGAAGVNGGPVVVLENPASGTSGGCADVKPDVAADLIQHPENYYVNVHSAAYPAGAVRGQLAKSA